MVLSAARLDEDFKRTYKKNSYKKVFEKKNVTDLSEISVHVGLGSILFRSQNRNERPQ